MPVNSRCVVVLAGTALLGTGLDQATKALMVATGDPRALTPFQVS
jgi:hypothetical protein